MPLYGRTPDHAAVRANARPCRCTGERPTMPLYGRTPDHAAQRLYRSLVQPL